MEQFGTLSTDDLSKRQVAALPHLACPGSITEQARRAGVGRTTIYRWMRDENFRRQLQQLREDALDLAQLELKGMAYRATTVIADSLDDESRPIRLRAALAALDLAQKAQYGQRLERRLDSALESMSLRKHTQWPPG